MWFYSKHFVLFFLQFSGGGGGGAASYVSYRGETCYETWGIGNDISVSNLPFFP